MSDWVYVVNINSHGLPSIDRISWKNLKAKYLRFMGVDETNHDEITIHTIEAAFKPQYQLYKVCANKYDLKDYLKELDCPEKWMFDIELKHKGTY